MVKFVVAVLSMFLAVGMASIKSVELEARNIDGNCHVNGYFYHNGQEFSLPGSSRCLKYKCQNGGVDIHEEACQLNNRCYPVNSNFEFECTSYRCEKHPYGAGFMYKPVSTTSRCADNNGNCHNPGDRFPYSIRGRYYNSCTCSVSGRGIHYTCTHYNTYP